MAAQTTASNGDVSGQTRPTRPTAGDSVGTAPTRTAGRDRDEAQSLAATLRHRRPTDQSLRRTDLNLTATYVNGDTATRPPTTPVDTVSSGSHSDGSASARPSGNFDSHSNSQDHVLTPSDSLSDLQSDNSVNDYRVTVIHPSN